MNILFHRVPLLYLMFFNPVRLFDRISRDPWYSQSQQQWIDALRLPHGARVLELGCGPGGLALELTRRGCCVTALDSSKKMVRHLSYRAKQESLSVEALVGDALSTDLPTGSCDAVIGASLLNVVTLPEALLAEAMRLVKPGGVVSFYFPTHLFSQSNVHDLVRAQDVPGASAAILLTWAEKANKLSPAVAESLFTGAGAQAIEVRVYLGGMLSSVSGRRAGQPGTDH